MTDSILSNIDEALGEKIAILLYVVVETKTHPICCVMTWSPNLGLDSRSNGKATRLFSSKDSVRVIARERSGRSNLRPATRGLLRQNTPRNDIQPQN